MKLRDPRSWLAAVSLVLVIGVVWFDRGRTSPGPLTAVHESVAKLAGASGCDECHAGGKSKLAADCESCHSEIQTEVAAHRGLHGKLEAKLATHCAECHVEHHGDQIELAGAHAFQKAGVADAARFDHAGLDFRLTGAHSKLACKECHRLAESKTLTETQHRFIGLEQRCSACHEDVHRGKFSSACEECHDQEHKFDDTSHFVHSAVFPLTGKHGDVTCETCHAKGGPFAIEVVGDHSRAVAPRECAACHASPHRAQFLDAVAKLAHTTAGESCAKCHDSTRPFTGDSAGMPRELHAASGLELSGRHARATCADCHSTASPTASPTAAATAAATARDASASDAKAAFLARYPGRAESECAACHVDPHVGQFSFGPKIELQCATCHQAEKFLPASFDVQAHAATAFALTGAHASAKCEACHVVAKSDPKARRTFHGTPTECAACHNDAHRGSFAARAKSVGEPAPGCAVCHDTQSFSTVAAQRFDHARATGFALDGKHASAECSACHKPSAKPDEPNPKPGANRRRFGFVADNFQGSPSACSTCHLDVHRGVFDQRDAPLLVEGRAGCARCHDTSSFAGEAARAFDHGRFTEFALVGGHAKASCESCHGAGTNQRALGDVRAKFAGSLERCATCHVDPHQGRFDKVASLATIEGREGCARCHTVESFANVTRATFDHATWTGFALEGAHRDAACEACHVPGKNAIAAEMRLGRSAGSNCADCHADAHAGQFAVKGANACERCHLDSSSFKVVHFDHQRDSRFALDATHAKLACSACHVPWKKSGGLEVVRFKPLGVECVDCHGNPGAKKLGKPLESPTSGGGDHR